MATVQPSPIFESEREGTQCGISWEPPPVLPGSLCSADWGWVLFCGIVVFLWPRGRQALPCHRAAHRWAFVLLFAVGRRTLAQGTTHGSFSTPTSVLASAQPRTIDPTTITVTATRAPSLNGTRESASRKSADTDGPLCHLMDARARAPPVPRSTRTHAQRAFTYGRAPARRGSQASSRGRAVTEGLPWFSDLCSRALWAPRACVRERACSSTSCARGDAEPASGVFESVEASGAVERLVKSVLRFPCRR
ncbi:hypothetical protein C8Q79DRAFT_110319 [Trametes meyenii]|nr:hypothetical protein C8Q79DRAFT_110319 [Trametes meyenii]